MVGWTTLEKSVTFVESLYQSERSMKILGEAICSVYIQPEGFGPPPQQQLGSYKKEFAQTFQTTEQKTGSQTFQQRSYQQMYDKRSYVNGTSSIEDFKVISHTFDFFFHFLI